MNQTQSGVRKPWRCMAVETWLYGPDYSVLWIGAFKDDAGNVVIRRMPGESTKMPWVVGQRYAL